MAKVRKMQRLPLDTPEWLRFLLCEVEVDIEAEVKRQASTLLEVTDPEYDLVLHDHRSDSHQRLREVLYGPEGGTDA